MSAPESIPLIDMGDRLRHARDNARFTQQDAAEKIGIARTTLVAIEKGQRRIRVDEIQQLAKLYGTSVNAILRHEAVHVDIAPRFRKTHDAMGDAESKAVEIMSRLVKAEVELENLLGIKRQKNYPPERQILRGDVKAQAAHDALEVRQRLGIGNAPISDIVTLLEMEVGVRVYVRRVDSRISGLFAYDEKTGPCMLLNANHPRERRTQSAAHEFGHLVATRNEPEILYEREMAGIREEHYADAFGRAFLTPPRTVLQKLEEVTAGSARMTRRHVILLAHFFGVSREAMVRRLEELSLVKTGTWDWFQETGGITNQHAKEVLGDRSTADTAQGDADRPTMPRLSMLAAEVYNQELLTEGQLLELLGLGRIELRELIGNLETQGSKADALPKFLP